jgi:hypothetical protein
MGLNKPVAEVQVEVEVEAIIMAHQRVFPTVRRIPMGNTGSVFGMWPMSTAIQERFRYAVIPNASRGGMTGLTRTMLIKLRISMTANPS